MAGQCSTHGATRLNRNTMPSQPTTFHEDCWRRPVRRGLMNEPYSREYTLLLIQERARLRNVLQRIYDLATAPTLADYVVVTAQIASLARAGLTVAPWDDWAT